MAQMKVFKVKDNGTRRSGVHDGDYYSKAHVWISVNNAVHIFISET